MRSELTFRTKIVLGGIALSAMFGAILIGLLIALTDLKGPDLVVVVGIWVAALLIMGTVMALFSTRLVTKSLSPVLDFAKGVAQGDVSRRLVVDDTELLGALAEAQNRMVTGLKSLVGGIGETSVHVGAIIEELAASSQEVNSATQEFSSTIQQVSRGAQNQARTVEETVQVINEIADMAVEVAERSRGAVDTSLRANQIAQSGGQSAELTASKMSQLQGAVEEAMDIIRNLGERSMQIGLVVDVITNIANQTNMLALNAAIEASRAGEHGRGFAVVAEEVRGLAEGSKRAADQIAKMVRDTENETNKVVRVMESSQETVVGSIQVITESVNALRDVAEVVNEIAGVVDSISMAAEQQRQAATRVAKTSEDIAAIAEETAASTEEASATAVEQTASMEEMTASIQELAEVGEKLREAVAEFQL
jgi:methyl-accepting chemotaxis protein